METAISTIERKRAVELTVSESVLKEAEAAGLDIPSVVEEALRAKIRVAQGERWREENREAVAWHNALVDRMGGTLHEVLAEESMAVAGDAV